MFRTLLLATFFFLSGGTPPTTAEDPLAELVKKTNALKGFTAEYRVTDREGVVNQVTLCYEAEDRAALTMKSAGSTYRMCCIGGEFFMELRGDARHWARVNMLDLMEAQSHVLTVDLRAEFPDAPESEAIQFGPGAYFEWNWIAGKDGEKPTTKLEIGWTGNRTHVCGWLKNLQARSLKPRETEDEFAWILDEIVEVQVSKVNGFITRAHSTDPGSKGDAVLETLDLEPPEDEVFSVSRSAPEGAQDDSAEMLKGMRSYFFNLARDGIWTRLAKWIDDGDVAWDEHSPQKLTRVFRALHAEQFGASIEDYSKRVRDWIDSVAEQLAARVRALDPGDAAGLAKEKSYRDEGLASLSESFDKDSEGYCEKVRPPASVPADARMADVFLECERNALRAEYESQVTDPLLALFREKTDAALAR